MERVDELRLYLDDAAEVEHIINVLNATPHCGSAGQSSYNGPNLNRMDVHAVVYEVDRKRMHIRRSGSGDFDTKLKMALEVRRRVEHIVGKEVVAFAEEKMIGTTAAAAPAPEFTKDELDWLSECGCSRSGQASTTCGSVGNASSAPPRCRRRGLPC